jgi:uncharacterized protein (DUF488 family)
LFSDTDYVYLENIKSRFHNEHKTLFTIGYEGKGIEKFLNSLIKNNIKVLCDVRKNPLSRKFGFSKTKLEHLCKQIEIYYIHMQVI